MNHRALILLVVLVTATSYVLADGMIITPSHEQRRVNLVNESRQIAFIAWKDGMEQMIIKTEIKTAVQNGKAHVWIFPVPAGPDDVVVQHIKRVEYYGGGKNLYDVTKSAVRKSADSTFIFSQVWPIIPASMLWTLSGSLTSTVGELGSAARAIGTATSSYGVTVHETITGLGLTSQIITAKDPNGLRNYIRDKYGVELPDQIEKIFSNYIGKNSSFVITESNGVPEAMAVMVEFPTDAPYFPLMPTSIYGSKMIPITIYVDGFWEPNEWRELAPRTEVEHRVSGTPPDVSGDEKFWGKFKKLTIISLTAPSKSLKEDFYLKKAELAEQTEFIREHATLFAIIILLAVFSVSGLATWILLSRRGDELSKYLVAGAASILTPIATAIALKVAGLRSDIHAPAFEKWWQNVLYYTAATYTLIMALIALVGFGAFVSYILLSHPGVNGGIEIAIALAFVLAIIGGGIFMVAIGAVPMYIMHRKWKRSNTGIPVPQLLLILLLNAVIYWVVRAWVFA